jgi:hypothetical protein
MSESRIGEYLHQMRIAADDATDFVGGMDTAFWATATPSRRW